MFETDTVLAYLQERNVIVLYILAAVASILMVGILRLRWREGVKKPWGLLPGRVPIFGHIHKIPSSEYFVETLEGWAAAHGDGCGAFELDLMRKRILVVCDEDRALEILKHRPMTVQRTARVSDATDSIGGSGVFSAEGQQWKQEHRLVTAALNHKNVQEYISVFKVMTQRLVKKWLEMSEKGAVSIDDDLTSVAADSIAKASMDKDFNFLNQGGGAASAAKDVQAAMGALNKRVASPLPFMYWRIPLIGQYLDGMGGAIFRVASVVNQVVRDHEKYKAQGSCTDRTFLSKVYEAMKSERSPLPRDRMVGNIITLFLAGTDTTSKALTTAMYLLAKDQKLQEELRQEADQVDLEGADLNDLLTLLPRVKSFLHEVHRWFAVPLLGLSVTKDIPFCGSTLQKGTDVLILTRYLSTSKNAASTVPSGPMGKPATEFCPRRWLVEAEDGSLTCPSPKPQVGSFMGFGYGVRSCPGRLYSEGLSFLILISVLQNLEWTLDPASGQNAEVTAPEFIHDVVMVPHGGVRLSMKKRIPDLIG